MVSAKRARRAFWRLLDSWISPVSGVGRLDRAEPCNAAGGFRQLIVVIPLTHLRRDRPGGMGADSPFGDVYRAHIGAVSGFFARRCSDPQTVADLS